MSEMAVSYFFGFAAGGFVLMAAIGVQALVAVFSSIPLAKRRYRENPLFDLKRARQRIVKVTLLTLTIVATATVLVLRFASASARLGFLFGMILAFALSMNRMTPNNAQNQSSFEEAYADCYPSSSGGNGK